MSCAENSRTSDVDVVLGVECRRHNKARSSKSLQTRLGSEPLSCAQWHTLEGLEERYGKYIAYAIICY